MKVTDIITDKVNRFAAGYVFTYSDFTQKVDKIDALTKALGRMVLEGKIRKLSPGRFYKPRFSEFGEIPPETYQIVKDLLEQNGKIIGYLTGYSVYNQLGLTTQVSRIIQIGANEPKKGITRGLYKIRFVKQVNRISKENIPLLRILDSINNIKTIPDASVEKSCKILSLLVAKINDFDRESFIRLAKKHNPSTRALTGAIIENCFGAAAAESLKYSLNPSSSYDLGITEQVLPNKQKWNIV